MTNVKDLAIRAQSYGIPGEVVDGNDAMTCYEATGRAAEQCRNGQGPYLLEFKTWRQYGHWQGDPDMQRWEYRDKVEHEWWLKRDPLDMLRKQYADAGFDTKELDALDAAAVQEVRDAIDYAKASPWPDLSEATSDVYAD